MQSQNTFKNKNGLRFDCFKLTSSSIIFKTIYRNLLVFVLQKTFDLFESQIKIQSIRTIEIDVSNVSNLFWCEILVEAIKCHHTTPVSKFSFNDIAYACLASSSSASNSDEERSLFDIKLIR